MLDSIEDYEWKPVHKDAYEKAFINMDRDLLYLADTYTDGRNDVQTTFDDFHQDRYEIRHRRNYEPPESSDEVVHSTMNWNEAEAFLENKT